MAPAYWIRTCRAMLTCSRDRQPLSIVRTDPLSSFMMPSFAFTMRLAMLETHELLTLGAWSHGDSAAVSAGVVGASAPSRPTDDMGLEVFRRPGVVRVLILTCPIIIHRLYSDRVLIRAEAVVNSRRPFPLHAHTGCVWVHHAAPSYIPDSSRQVCRNHIAKS